MSPSSPRRSTWLLVLAVQAGAVLSVGLTPTLATITP